MIQRPTRWPLAGPRTRPKKTSKPLKTNSVSAPFFELVGDREQVTCFDADGQIVRLDMVAEEVFEVVDSSFSEFLMKEIEDLKDCKDRKVRGEDQQY